MAGQQLNLKLRTDTAPQQLLLNLVISPIGLRLLGILFAIVVFGCVSDQVYPPDNLCPAYSLSNACSFAVAVGVIAFLLCLVLLLKDVASVIIDFSEAVKVKLALNLADAIICGFWGFMWFVCFCFTADQRRKVVSHEAIGDSAIDCANAGIAFSFFSIIVWVAIVVYNVIVVIRIFKGSDKDSSGMRQGGGSGYASFPDNQQPPSGYDEEKSAPYNPPEY